ncbi:DUF448 domain-containing protein [Qipengyuania marisflavi]|uniref:DUF448 domain-containing protein n=1 Tax=Qipengyuania marisflavi TaxID=2486356 RepID=A0A5S3P0G3_9SPHN|nr:DUF448 domain-containing protein [Qipengyuania marisflavi]TMM46212.1 DUF448 domain-containing protein [Qipengyuania marisflavi]
MRTPHNERLTSDTAEAPTARRDSGRAKSCPERRCVITGEVLARDTLVRLAISPSGLVLPDAQERAPGRGAWIGTNRADLEAAMASGKLKGGLARAYKTGELEIPEELPQKIEDALTRVVLDRLGLEMRVGSLILGTQRIIETARGGGVTLLLHASDSSEDGRKKLDQAWRVGREAEGSGERGMTLPLDRAALSVALGRDNVVHLALADDAAAGRVLKALTRLLHYLGHAVPMTEPGVRNAARADDDLTD